MTWPRYGEFLAFAVLLVLVPGPDFAVVAKDAADRGPGAGRMDGAGGATSNLGRGRPPPAGLVLIIRAQPVLRPSSGRALPLAFLGAQAIRSAIRGR